MASDPRVWGLARYLLVNLGGFAIFIFVPFFIVTMVVAFLIDQFATLDGSVWAGATLIVRLYALAMAVHVISTHFPLFLAQGGTRREYFRQLVAFLIGHGALLAALVTLGFWLESLVAGLFDWPITVSSYTFFDLSTDVLPILATFVIVMVTWSVAAALGATALYRSRDAGGFAVVVGVLVVVFTESSLGNGFRFLGFLSRILDYRPASLAVSTAVGGVVAASSLVAIWSIIRTMPVKSSGG